MLKVMVCDFDELPEQCKEQVHPYNRHGSFIVVEHNGQVIEFQSSQMEPEDVSFWRDLKWIPEVIMKVYRLGQEDALEPLKDLKV